ncbi:MAG: exodeoxyribonuclease VII large subunit [Planctomycetaceae bacterium]|nr:exodeoxyribonuclease VII large subunit [Planctomycetaceae bacterium]
MRRGLGTPQRPVRDRNESEALSVSELTRTIKSLLEGRIGTVSVTGEVAGIKASPSGHVYFALKDSMALVDCVIWRSAAGRLRSLPDDGAKVTVRGKLGVYEPRGRYQLIVTSIVAEKGKGDLWQQFEELKAKLAAEGLFNQDRKKPLPPAPRTIGIVTSPGGAALRDMLKILSRRSPSTRVVVSPATVQGFGAAREIVAAIERLEQWGGAEVIIVGRGGGSLEDLWCFNDEAVARAIAVAGTPVVSAVGHETDFTIADFVADARAATPSEAAEYVVPDSSHLRGRVAHAAMVLSRALGGAVRERREALRGVARCRLYRHPEDLFQGRWQRLDDTVDRMADAAAVSVRQASTRLELLEARLKGINPLAVLERGYAVVLGADGKAVTDATLVKEGDVVQARLHKGTIGARVTETIGVV